MSKYFPFETEDYWGNPYPVFSNLKSKDIYMPYYSLFSNLGYEGNGYCWEGHIRQVLKEIDKDLLQQLNFDSQTDVFYAFTNTKECQEKFLQILTPIFSDLDKLEKWVKKADRAQIDD